MFPHVGLFSEVAANSIPARFERLCPGVQPGGGRIIGCLKAHKEEISIGCGKALQAMKAKMGT